jgi:hypothetical protein
MNLNTINQKKLNRIISESINKVISETTNSQIKRKYINKIHKFTHQATSKMYKDEFWEGVDMTLEAINNAIGEDGDVEVTVKNGGYADRIDVFPNYKQYNICITLNCGVIINGVLKCHAAGTIENPFERYDITVNFW